MLNHEYVVNPKTQDRMNAFYNQQVSEFGRSIDSGAS